MTSIERHDTTVALGPSGTSDPSGLDVAAPSDDLAAAAERLHAWHAVAGGTARDAEQHVGRDLGQDAGPDLGREAEPDAPAAELADRLRARRSAGASARHVAAAYAATHGHPLDARDDTGHGWRRWGLGLRSAVVASLVVLLLALGASVVAFLQPDDVVTLAAAEPAGGAAQDEAEGAGEDEAEDAAQDEAETPEGVAAAADTGSAAGAASVADAAGEKDGASEAATAQAVVHVVGEVREPGLVTVPADARVADAVQAAGGPTGRADTAAVNLARAVVDGEQIVVPAPGEAPPAGAVDASGGATGTTGAGGGAGGAAATGGVLDLNTAAAADLDSLPGIGPVLAERVVAWRDENGPFTSVDELEEVSGIGPSVLEQVRDLVRV